LLRLIARGSYGEVWLGRSTLGAYRAVKIVFERTFRDKRPFERELAGVQRFEPVSRLHDGLMDVLQVGRNEEVGYFYCVMELADDVSSGKAIEPDTYVPHTLAREVARQKRLPVESCLQVGITIASALEFLHQHGLIHRDIKPSNIVFINGTPKLVDIGLVAEMSEARSYVGTEGFIPPEGPGTVQADIYSLGKVLYEISTGKDRYDYPELPTSLDDTAHGTELLGLNQVILRACRTEPRQRYQSAGDMLRDLRALQAGRPVSSRPWEHPRFRLGARLFSSIAVVAMLLVLFGRLRHPSRLEGAGGNTSTAGSVSVPAGLVSWWRGEGDASDATGRNPGVLLHGASFAPGKVGQSFKLNGKAACVHVASSTSLNLTNSLSLEAWVYLTAFSENDGVAIAGKDDPYAVRQYLLGLGKIFGQWVFRSHVGVVNEFRYFDGSTSVRSNTWYHVAMTYDGSSLKLYVNGKLDGSAAVSGPVLTSDQPLVIGGESPGPWNFQGLIDEVSLYDRALSETEVRAIYGAGSAGKRLQSGRVKP
jgi:hypothetical protein